MTETADLVLVGGGLANGLLALRLRALRPELRLLVLEAGGSLGGNHTWSFHGSDVSAEAAKWLAPLVAHSWPAYDVAFDGLSRRVEIPYRTITSGRFHDVVSRELGDALRLGAAAAAVEPTRVMLADGSIVRAGAVVDGRGPARGGPGGVGTREGWQVFVGQEVRFTRPHGLSAPMVMDATVSQADGYRFVYVLPFGPDTALVEDTYYQNTPAYDPGLLRARIRAYVADRGWEIAAVMREEEGALPVIMGGGPEAFWQPDPDVPRTGLRAGLFHHTTGYSLPDAVRLADEVAAMPDLSASALAPAIRAMTARHWRRQGFFRLLNRMLFLAATPPERAGILRRFYGLPDDTVRRFYAGELSAGDKIRLVTGRPPVPFMAGVRAAFSGEARL